MDTLKKPECGPLARTLILAVVGLASGQAGAGTVAGTGGSTEITQIANNLQLVQIYEQHVASYIRQGLQLENEIKNLMNNPTSVLGPDVGNMINTIGQIMSGGQSIGYNLSQIDKNFSNLYKNPTAANFSTMFTRWHQTNTDTLQSVLRSIGTTRDQYATNQDALTDLYNRSQSSSGNLQALQTLSQINVRQIQQLQSLQDLIANQATAEATFMATQTAKDQKMLDITEAANDKDKRNIPDVGTAPAPKWKDFWK